MDYTLALDYWRVLAFSNCWEYYEATGRKIMWVEIVVGVLGLIALTSIWVIVDEGRKEDRRGRRH